MLHMRKKRKRLVVLGFLFLFQCVDYKATYRAQKNELKKKGKDYEASTQCRRDTLIFRKFFIEKPSAPCFCFLHQICSPVKR